MNIKKDYTDLYQHWLAEFDQTGLTPFFQEDFDSYKRSVNKIKATELQSDDSIKIEILDSYKINFEYLLEDLLKIRKIKIMNAALSMQEINLEYILEPEKLLYQNLIRSLKGYAKLKKLSTTEDYSVEDLTVESLYSTHTSQKPEIESNLKEEIETEIQSTIHEEKTQVDEKFIESTVKNEISTDYNYTIIRFVKDTPPLVGIDLKNYGPFSKNDIANLPYKNAIILLNEKFAEKVDLS